ncbi:MAG: SPOR domain-containing protein [Vicingaceae bacterium]
MQTVKIDVYIADLLYSYDCVVVPEFGGFIANYAPAKVQATQHKFTPPSKKISFNKHLKVNDGLLTNHIAVRRSVSYVEANELIQAFVNQSIAGLNKGDKIKIEKVGTLFLDPERNIQFVAEAKNDFLLESFGLSSFRALPVERQTKEQKIKEQLPELKEKAKQKKRYYLPAAAFLALALTSAFWLNQQFDWVSKSDIQYSSLNFGNTEEAVYKSNAVNIPSVEPILENKKLNLAEGIVPYVSSTGEKSKLFVDNRKEETETKIDNTAIAKSNSKSGLKFHVLGGCFSNLSNAEGLVNKLTSNGFNARLIGTYNSLHAVSMGSFSTREEATALLSDVRNNQYPSAWLLVKQY